MLKFKSYKPSLVLVVLACVFGLTWAVWTFVMVPHSATPSLPVAPSEPRP